MRLGLSLNIADTRAGSLLPGLSLSASTVPEGSAQGTDIATLTPTNASNPGAVSIASQEVLNLFQMNVDGVTLEVGTGAAGLDYETRTSATVTLEYTDDNDTYQFLRTINIAQVAPSIVTPLSDLTNTVGNGPFVIDYSSAYAGSLRTVELYDIPTDSGVTIDTVAETITVPDETIGGPITVRIYNDAGEVFDEFNVDISVSNGAPEVVLNTIALTVPAGTDGIPENTVAPALSGTTTEGETLTTTNGTWTGDATITYAYQWQRSDDGSTGWADISGATSSTYDLVSADATKYVRSEVTATNGVGSTVEVSAASAQIAAASGGITFVGRTAPAKSSMQGGTLSLTSLTGGSDTAPSDGDLVIAVFSGSGAADRNPGISTSGYTNINDDVVNDTHRAHLYVSYKFMTATPDTDVAFTSTSAGNDARILSAYVFRGVDPTTPLDVAAVVVGSPNDSDPNPGSITPVTSGAKLFFALVSAHNVGAVDLSQAYLSNSLVDNHVSVLRAVSIAQGTVDWTSGAYDGATATLAGGDASCSWLALAVALRPA